MTTNQDGEQGSGRVSRGTSRGYLLQRIAQVDPAAAERVRRGHISAYRAACDLGLAVRRFSVNATSPDTVARSIRSNLSHAEVRQLAQLLADSDGTP